MKQLRLAVLASLCVLLLAATAMAYGPHDENCAECHSIHVAKGANLAAVAAPQEKYPTTGEALKGSDAFCMGCHNKGTGIMPVDLHKTHPVGVTPKKARVPAGNLSAGGTFGCMSCHDPHPANPNYKYLVVDTRNGKEMGKFCSYCHPSQAAPAGAAPASKPAATAPAAPKKK